MTANPAAGQAGTRLRPASIADLDPIHAIEATVFGRDAWSREALREELTAQHRHYLALVDSANEVRGYAGLLVVGEEGDIQTIAVDAAMRGGGHGRALMEALIAEARSRGVSEIFLEVRADNPIAHGLYVRLGFAEIGVRPRYYQPDGVDAIVMRLDAAAEQGAPSTHEAGAGSQPGSGAASGSHPAHEPATDEEGGA